MEKGHSRTRTNKLTAIPKVDKRRPEDSFQDLFRSYEMDAIGSKYRKRLSEIGIGNQKSLVVDFVDLVSFDPILARSLVEHPDDFISFASSAATAQMRIEDPYHANEIGKVFARFRGLPETLAIRNVNIENRGKLVSVVGLVSNVRAPHLVIIQAVYRCRRCLEIIREDQSGKFFRGPSSTCPNCKQRSAFELLEEQSMFKNKQKVRLVELVSDKSSKPKNARSIDIILSDDLVDSVKIKDRIRVTAIVRIESSATPTRTEFALVLEANDVCPLGDAPSNSVVDTR